MRHRRRFVSRDTNKHVCIVPSRPEARVSKFAGARPLASAVPAAVRPRQFWPPHHPQGRNRPPHLGFQQCDHPSRCGAEPPNQQEPHTHSKWWRRHDADDDGNGRYAEAHRPARTIPRPRRPLSSVGQSCGLLIRRSWVRAPQGVPTSGLLGVFRTVLVLCFRLPSLSSGARVLLRSGCDNLGLSEGGHGCISARSMRQYP